MTHLKCISRRFWFVLPFIAFFAGAAWSLCRTPTTAMASTLYGTLPDHHCASYDVCQVCSAWVELGGLPVRIQRCGNIICEEDDADVFQTCRKGSSGGPCAVVGANVEEEGCTDCPWWECEVEVDEITHDHNCIQAADCDCQKDPITGEYINLDGRADHINDLAVCAQIP